MSDLKQLNEMIAESFNEDEYGEKISVVDFKMVTFSLAGKDYAIDVMKVSEIEKAGNFTFVPNTSPFVLGVYNLRGEIIPIIDLRIFFNIPIPARKRNQIQSMVIVNVEEQKFGVVVDSIDKVVGISKKTIQQPHPIFGDINIKYIQGVVENSGRLYVLLDVDMILGNRKTESRTETTAQAPIQAMQPMAPNDPAVMQQGAENLDIAFIGDTLQAMGKFYPSPVNEDWMRKRYQTWRDSRPAGDIQISNETEANEYMSGFISPFTGGFWSERYMNAFYQALPDTMGQAINVWNVGCGSGYETYSLAVVLKMKYPRARIRIFANDSDLLSISTATTLRFPPDGIDSVYKPYIVRAVDGSYSFNQDIKDMILFEYHDCTNQNVMPDIDLILARDVLSFNNLDTQNRLLAEFNEKLKTTGVIFLGANECMPKQSGWARFSEGDIVFFGRE